MTDREKVIEGLEHCRRGPIGCQQGCPYTSDFGCRSQLTADALELLKEPETIGPIDLGLSADFIVWGCPNCERWLDHDYQYCPYCGRKVKWDE